ncbi:Putative integrase (fragment) [Candidatus Terasakiella magnetica]|uniref:Integrase n=1 Tax=Candidatus Terasakiella magnetica TaxID=1867952 RepID=A0A1C3RLE6_9PROT
MSPRFSRPKRRGDLFFLVSFTLLRHIAPMEEQSLYEEDGEPRYLTQAECKKLLACLKDWPDVEARYFIKFLYFTGTRLGEALLILPSHFRFDLMAVMVPTLKRRQKKKPLRRIDLPKQVMEELDAAFSLRLRQKEEEQAPLWSWHKNTALRRVKKIMLEAGLTRKAATAKALRHAFGVRAIQKGVDLVTLQDLMGHADINNTALYARAMGKERREITSKLWDDEEI